MVITLIFPHQLFKQHPAVAPGRKIYLVEEALFFHQYNFHKKKIILHRATMQAYAAHLTQNRFEVSYVAAQSPLCDIRQLIKQLSLEGLTALHYADVTDNWLEKRISETAKKNSVVSIQHKTPAFLNTVAGTEEFFQSKARVLQTDFYIQQRISRNILMEGSKPLGGKWTFDTENRKPFPKGEVVPAIPLPPNNPYVTEAISYTEEFFGNNPGDILPPFYKRDGFYPVTFSEAESWLEAFLEQRFTLFGPYEDAMQKGQGLLYHSCLSPLLNTGLLTPQFVLDKTLEAASNFTVPLNSLEGFIRQLIGWREYVHLIYEWRGSTQRTQNFWGFTRHIPQSFYTGTTGIHPIDVVIKRLLNNGYSHHIERLMVLANFMLLCEFHPDEVYRWFMEMYIDAYDWVMVPNTYGMTQAADGGKMMTKPYISGSNYLLKMGNWDKGPWQQVWDGLFWRFMDKQKTFFAQNPRLGMLLKTFTKMPAVKRAAHLKNAEDFLQGLGA